MTTRSTDINLIIRARTEGEKAITALGDTLEHVFGEARDGNTDLAAMVRSLATLDKAAGTVGSSVDKATAALDRQQSSITENKAALAALVAQQSEARQVLASFGDQSEKAFVGPRTESYTKNYAAVRAEADRLQVSITQLNKTIGSQESQLQGAQSSLLRLSAISRAVGDGQAEAAAQIELTNEALRRQADEGRRVAAAQSFYNAKGGPSRGSATDNGATYDALIANLQRLEGEAARASRAIDPVGNAIRDTERAIRDVHDAASHGIIASDEAIIRERQLRDELDQTIAKIASGAARVRQARKDSVTEYQALINSVTGVTGPRATDSGATYEALAQREAENQRLQAQQRAREAEALRAAAERNTGVTGARATDNGATFSALEAEAQANALRLASQAYQAFEAAARKGMQAMREADAAVERDTADIRQLRAALDPIAAIQERFNTSLERYRELAAAGKISTDELAAAERHLAAEAERARNSLGSGRLGLFGLRPYELQNLSYQINDVVTGLASGQHLGQVVAQQGGQILQLFPKVGGAIVGALTNPFILAGAAGFTAIAVSIGRAASEAERLRDTSADLKLSADGTIYDPKELDDSAKGLRGYGASIDGASKSLKIFAEAGLNPDRLDQFGRSAQDLSDVTGVKLPDAAKKLADGFSGGYEAVAKLDDELNFLTATQRESIKQAFEDGNAQQARAQAFSILSDKLSEAAAIQRGSATEATRSLKKGYDDLLDSLARTSLVQGTIDFFGKLGKSISEATGNATAFTAAADRAARIVTLRKEIADLDATIGATERKLRHKDDRTFEPQARAAKQAELNQLEAQQRSEAKAAQQQQSDTIRQGTEAQRKADIAAGLARDRLLVQAQKQAAAEKGITTEAEKQLRLRVAEQTARQQVESSNPRASDAAKQAVVDAALANERATIAREDAQRAKAAKAEREREISQFESRVVGAEGGTGKNPFSSARGYGQFTEGTFLDVYRRTPGADQSLGRYQILALRENEKVARGVLDRYARENARFLESFGAKVTAGNLYLTHFLGPAGAKAVLQAPKDKPVDQILSKLPNSAAVLSGNAGYLRANGGKGRYVTAGELQAFVGARVGATGAAQTGLVDEQARIVRSNADRQEALNQAVRHGNEDRAATVKALEEENRLNGVALIQAERRKAIADAERELRQKAEDSNRNLAKGETPSVVSDAQVKEVKDLAGALFDAQHARETLNAELANVQRPVDNLQQQIDLLRQQSDYLRSIGDNSHADVVDKQIKHLSGSIQDAYDRLIEYYRALTPEKASELGIQGTWEEQQQQIGNIIAKLQLAKQTTQEWGKIAGVSSKEIAQSLGSNLASSFTNFINRVASGKNVFKALGESVREFAANFISSIAQMIVQLLAYAAAVSILRALGVPIPGGGGTINNPSVNLDGVLQTPTFGGGAQGNPDGVLSFASHHVGGVIGSAGGQKRSLSQSIFAGAMRFHTGGVVGIGADEVPIIAKRGEEVLTEGDPRHRANGGLGGGAPAPVQPIKIVNAFDPAEVVAQGLGTKAGERVLLNFVTKNQRAFKAALN